MRPPASRDIKVSRIMSANKATGTKLELKVRQSIAGAGYRGCRLNWSKAPGRPDIAFVKRKIAIVVNGCFWHGCKKCIKKTPRANKKYWTWKIESNRKRDRRDAARLRRLGWRVYRVWEHDVKKGNLQPMLSCLKRELKKRA